MRKCCHRNSFVGFPSTSLLRAKTDRCLSEIKNQYHSTPSNRVGVLPKAKASRVVKGESPSSTKWLRRQLTDEFVKKAHDEGYLSRAAYKLLWIDEKHGSFLKPGKLVIDLGAAPGGWTQVALQKVKNVEGKKDGVVISVDLQDLPNLGSANIKGDFTDEGTKKQIRDILHGKQADVILSDMAPSATGHRDMDHLKLIVLNEEVMAFAEGVLKKDGALVMKTSRGGSEKEMLTKLKSEFKSAKYCKPDASRKDSAEIFLVATGFQKDKGKKENSTKDSSSSQQEKKD